MRFNVGKVKLAELKLEALSELTSAIATARLKYIPALPGQEMVYLAKKTDAENYLNATSPDPENYQWVLAESRATDVSMHDAAILISTRWAEWQIANATIERIKRSGTIAINEAQSVSEVYDLKTVAISSLLAV